MFLSFPKKRNVDFEIPKFKNKRRIKWLVGCRVKASCPLLGPGLTGEMLSVGGLSQGS